jgi:hypothetical protein
MGNGTKALMLALGTPFLVTVGCDRSDGLQLVPVSGNVSLNGKPLTMGSVSLRADAAKGNKSMHHPTGAIEKDGSYRLYTANRPGAETGWYHVVVFANDELTDLGLPHPGMPKSIINRRYNDQSTSGLAFEVVATAPPGAYDLKLAE